MEICIFACINAERPIIFNTTYGAKDSAVIGFPEKLWCSSSDILSMICYSVFLSAKKLWAKFQRLHQGREMLHINIVVEVDLAEWFETHCIFCAKFLISGINLSGIIGRVKLENV